MAYEKQTFLDEIKDENGNVTQEGTVLKAENLNHMEDGIAEANKAIVSVGGDTLTWDGNTEGLVVVEDMFYKVSDAIVMSDVLDKDVIIHLEGEEITLTMYAALPGVIVGEEGAAVFVSNEGVGADIDGVVFDEPGVYFRLFEDTMYVSSLTIPGYTGFEKKQVNPEYLPESDIVVVSLDFSTMKLSHTPQEIDSLMQVGKLVVFSLNGMPFVTESHTDGTVTAKTTSFQVSVGKAMFAVMSFDASGVYGGVEQYTVDLTQA